MKHLLHTTQRIWVQSTRHLRAAAAATALSVLAACGGGEGAADVSNTVASEPLAVTASIQAGVVYVPPEQTKAWIVKSTISDLAGAAATSFELPLTENVAVGGIYLVNEIAYKIDSIQVNASNQYILVSQPELKEIFKTFKMTGDLPLTAFEAVTPAPQTGLLHGVTDTSVITNFNIKSVKPKDYEPSDLTTKGCFKLTTDQKEIFDNGITVKPMGFKIEMKCDIKSNDESTSVGIAVNGGVYPNIKFGSNFDLVDVNTYDANVKYTIYTSIEANLTGEAKVELQKIVRLISVKSAITIIVPIGPVPVPIVVNIWTPLDVIFQGETDAKATVGYKADGKFVMTKSDGVKFVNLTPFNTLMPSPDATLKASFTPQIRPGFGVGLYGLIPISFHPKVGVKFEVEANMQKKCMNISAQVQAGFDAIILPRAWIGIGGDPWEKKHTKELITLMDIGDSIYENKIGNGCNDPVANITIFDNLVTPPLSGRNLNGGDLKLGNDGFQILQANTSRYADSYEWKALGPFGNSAVVSNSPSYVISKTDFLLIPGGVTAIQLTVGNGLDGVNKNVSQRVNLITNKKPFASGGIVRTDTNFSLASTAIDPDGSIVAIGWSDMGGKQLWKQTSNNVINVPIDAMKKMLGTDGLISLKLKVWDNDGDTDEVTVVETPVSPGITSIAPGDIIRTLTGNFDVAGRDLPTSGISVVVPGDTKASCQTPTTMTANGFSVACVFNKLGTQTLEIRQGTKVLGTTTVLVKTNVTGVTWSSPSTSNSGMIKFHEDVTFKVAGVNLLADPVMGFAVQLCGVSNVETGLGAAGRDTQRTFMCNFNNDAGAVAGQMPGVIKDAPGGQVLFDGWNVPVETTAFYDTFDGSVLDTTKWNFHPNPVYGGNYMMSGSELTFNKAWADTLNKVAFSGSKIVIEARIAGKMSMRDSSVQLLDISDPNNRIQGHDTNYSEWGLTIQNAGLFNLIGANINRGAQTGTLNVQTNGVSFSTYKVIRLTIEGNLVTLERGDSIDALTEKMERTMGASIVGRSFYLLIGTGAPDYTPGSFDYVRVTTY